jgi:hypothetical protein
MSRAARARRSGGSLMWLQGLACGAMVALVPALALLLGVLLIPGLVALVLDRQPGRPVARCVLLCGAAGCITPVMALWNAGQGMDVSLAILGQLSTLGTAWSGAAGGWLMAELLPVVVRVVLEAGSLTKAAQLKAARARLAEEWGTDSPNG